jgi:hypothetical protein
MMVLEGNPGTTSTMTRDRRRLLSSVYISTVARGRSTKTDGDDEQATPWMIPLKGCLRMIS